MNEDELTCCRWVDHDDSNTWRHVQGGVCLGRCRTSPPRRPRTGAAASTGLCPCTWPRSPWGMMIHLKHFQYSSTKHVWYNAQVSKNSLEAEEYPNYFSVGHCFGEWVTSTKFREFVFNKTNWMTWWSTNVVGPSFPSSSHHRYHHHCQHHHDHHQLTIGQHEGSADCRAPSRSTRWRCSSPSRWPAPPAPSSCAPVTSSGQVGFDWRRWE